MYGCEVALSHVHARARAAMARVPYVYQGIAFHHIVLYPDQHNNRAKMDAASIRVNAATLKDFPGRVVRLIGKATSVDPSSDSATLDAGGPVHVSTHGSEQIEAGKFYEVIGKCSVSDFKINSYSVMPLSDNLNLEMANKLAALVPKVSELFY